jgi:Ca2+-binding EF-hand superfamily protein
MKRHIIAAMLALPLAQAAHAQDPFDPVALFATADANGDGAVSKPEFLARRAQTFPQLDANGDGIMTQEELLARAKGFRARAMAGQIYANFDRNGDGRVTQDEFASAPALVFDRADANADGLVTKAEIEAARR